MHVFEPRFGGGADTPAPMASAAMYRQMQARLGLQRVVVVQANRYGSDNRGMLDAMAEFGDSARGVAVIEPDTDEAELQRLTRWACAACAFTCCPADTCNGRSSTRWPRGCGPSAGMCSCSSTAGRCRCTRHGCKHCRWTSSSTTSASSSRSRRPASTIRRFACCWGCSTAAVAGSNCRRPTSPRASRRRLRRCRAAGACAGRIARRALPVGQQLAAPGARAAAVGGIAARHAVRLGRRRTTRSAHPRRQPAAALWLRAACSTGAGLTKPPDGLAGQV